MKTINKKSVFSGVKTNKKIYHKNNLKTKSHGASLSWVRTTVYYESRNSVGGALPHSPSYWSYISVYSRDSRANEKIKNKQDTQARKSGKKRRWDKKRAKRESTRK